MFEKDAEEFVDSKKSFWRQGRTCIDSVRQAFQKGAEFGYNEGFKDCAKARLNVTTISDCPIKDEWHYLEDGKFPENYRRVLITVLDDEGKRVVVSGMFVTKIINRQKKTKKIWYWLYDSDDVFVTSGSPGECSKPIAWMPFPEPCGGKNMRERKESWKEIVLPELKESE